MKQGSKQGKEHPQAPGTACCRAAGCSVAQDLVQYGAYYLGFTDRHSGWEGTECIRLAASLRAHARFFAGHDVSETPGRLGMVLEALGVIECDDAAEIRVSWATRSGTEPRQLKAMLRRCGCRGLCCLVFLLTEEEAPCVAWEQGK